MQNPIFWILSSGVSLIALLVIFKSLFPKMIEDIRTFADDEPSRSFWLGLVNFLFLTAISIGLASLGEGLRSSLLYIPFFLVVAFIIVGMTLGLAGITQIVGERLFPERLVVRRSIYSSGMLYLACLTPFIGWFGLFPYVGLTGFGGFILSAWKRIRSQEVESQSVTE